MPSNNSGRNSESFYACALLVLCLGAAPPLICGAQAVPSQALGQSSGPTAQSFQGSVVQGDASAQPLDLSLDDAMQRGLRNNLGIILNGTQTAGARGQRLSDLQSLLPEVDFKAQESGAAGRSRRRRSPHPWLSHHHRAIRLHRSAWHRSRGRSSTCLRCATISQPATTSPRRSCLPQDARDLVVLTVGNAYLLVLADEARVSSIQAQVATSKISLNQAVANHQAGTAPLLDELRARVDYQSLEQQLIAAQNGLEKDKLSLARTIGLPLAQKFNLTDTAPYEAFDLIDIDKAIHDAHANRKDLAAMIEQTKAPRTSARRRPMSGCRRWFSAGDYGDIGVNVAPLARHRRCPGHFVAHRCSRSSGLRGEAQIAQAQLDTAQGAVE